LKIHTRLEQKNKRLKDLTRTPFVFSNHPFAKATGEKAK